MPPRCSSDSKAAIAFGEDPVKLPVGLYGIRFTLKIFGSSSSASERALLDAIVHAREHHVLDEDLAPPQLEVAPAFREDVCERITVVDRHQLRSERRLGRVQREGKADRLFDLVYELPQPGQPADRRHGRPAMCDAEIRETTSGRDHLVYVQHRLPHTHEDDMVDRFEAAEMQA
jgi:hypothetical protein